MWRVGKGLVVVGIRRALSHTPHSPCYLGRLVAPRSSIFPPLSFPPLPHQNTQHTAPWHEPSSSRPLFWPSLPPWPRYVRRRREGGRGGREGEGEDDCPKRMKQAGSRSTALETKSAHTHMHALHLLIYLSNHRLSWSRPRCRSAPVGGLGDGREGGRKGREGGV